VRLNARRIVTLNLGVGRDSTTALCLLCEGKLVVHGIPRGPRDIDAGVFVDTGLEWPHTYALVPRIRRICRQHGIPFYVVKKPRRVGPRGWAKWLRDNGQPLLVPRPWRTAETIEARVMSGWYHLRPPILQDYLSRQTVVSLGKGDCTDNHKIQPIRKLIQDLAVQRFGVKNNRSWGAQVGKETRPPHLTLIGIAADEAGRAKGRGKVKFVTEGYPLLEMDIGRPDEAEVLSRWDLNHTRKSGCMHCPYQPAGWYWAMGQLKPKTWEEVLEYERTSLEKNPNMFVTGKKTLRVFVSNWRRKNPEADVDSVLDKSYKRGGIGA